MSGALLAQMTALRQALGALVAGLDVDGASADEASERHRPAPAP